MTWARALVIIGGATLVGGIVAVVLVILLVPPTRSDRARPAHARSKR